MPNRTKVPLKTRGVAATIRRGRKPRAVHLELIPVPQAETDARAAQQIQWACDHMLVSAIRRGLADGRLVQTADGTIRPNPPTP